MSKRPSIKQQQKKQPDSLIQVVSVENLDDYKREQDLIKKLEDQRNLIQVVKNSIKQHIARLVEYSETIKQEINKIKQALSELRKKKIFNQNQQNNFSETQNVTKVRNNKQEYTVSQIPANTEISKEFLESNVKLVETRQPIENKKKIEYFGDESKKKQLSQGDSQLVLGKQPPPAIIQQNIEKKGLQQKQLQDISIQILPKQPKLSCLINHTLVEDYQQEYQIILPLLFQNILASNRLSVKCICGIKIRKSQIIEPRNRIIFESIMEKQLEVLLNDKFHLKCSNISCNYRFIYETDKIKPRYYCPMCDELCHFVIKV